MADDSAIRQRPFNSTTAAAVASVLSKLSNPSFFNLATCFEALVGNLGVVQGFTSAQSGSRKINSPEEEVASV